MCMGCGVSGRAGTNLGNIIVRRAGEPLEMLSYAIIVFFFNRKIPFAFTMYPRALSIGISRRFEYMATKKIEGRMETDEESLAGVHGEIAAVKADLQRLGPLEVKVDSMLESSIGF